MFEKGAIIQYFRQKKGLTQEELGHGICSKTHLSKIERGLTEVSDETISLLCERMGFSIDEEIKKLKNVQKSLESLQKQIIFQDENKSSKIIAELEKEEFNYIPPLYLRFLILKARYLMVINNLNEAKKILFSKELKNHKIPQPEENLLNHTLGIYYIQTLEIHKAIDYLKKVTLQSYNNQEVHYHLALAYCHLNAYISSYQHCQKAKEYFVQTHNYQRLVDTESISLILLEEETHLHFNEIEARYENLLNSVNKIKDQDRESYLLHNFAYQHYKFKKFIEASKIYKRTLLLLPKQSVRYLTTLFGYMRCIFEGELEETERITLLIKEGLEEAKAINNIFYFHLFQLYEFKINNDTNLYYKYLNESALPYFYEIKSKEYFEPFAKEYSNYLISINDGNSLYEFFKNYQIKFALED